MTIARIGKPSDATWQRAWEVADAAELATLMGTYLDPLGPKRGDIIVQLDDGIYYQVVTANVVKPVNLLEIDNTWLGDNNFDTGVFELGRSTAIGEWENVPFSAGDFTASGAMTWTVIGANIGVNQVMQIGHTMWWNFGGFGTVGGTPSTELRIAIPFGETAAKYQDNRASYMEDNSVQETDPGFVYFVGTGSTYVTISKTDGTVWTAGVAYIDFIIAFEIEP